MRRQFHPLSRGTGPGKLCLGYSNDPSIDADRVRQFTELTPRDGRLNRCGRIDLMMIHGLEPNAARWRQRGQWPVDLWHDLTAFETCVRFAADRG